jgi:hypothetical protein
MTGEEALDGFLIPAPRALDQSERGVEVTGRSASGRVSAPAGWVL